jgi:hypothetical protein
MIVSERLPEILPDIFANLLRTEAGHCLIWDHINLTVVAELGEVANDSKNAKITSGSGERLGNEPVNN